MFLNHEGLLEYFHPFGRIHGVEQNICTKCALNFFYTCNILLNLVSDIFHVLCFFTLIFCVLFSLTMFRELSENKMLKFKMLLEREKASNLKYLLICKKGGERKCGLNEECRICWKFLETTCRK